MANTDIAIWLGVWAVTAAVSVLLTGIETFARARRVHVGFAREMVQCAVEQFLPAVMVGFLLTVVMVRVAAQDCWMLPGLGIDLQPGRVCLVPVPAAADVRGRRVVSGGWAVLFGRRKRHPDVTALGHGYSIRNRSTVGRRRASVRIWGKI